jgi:sulfur carrier protein
MKLRVNGDVLELPEPCNLDNLIRHLGLAGRRLAVEMNGEIVPRSNYATCQLADGDQLEIVQAIGGG